MSFSRSGPHNMQGVPTLTEVIELPNAARNTELVDPPTASAQVHESEAPAAATAAAPEASEEPLIDRVLADLLRHADLMLEYRLREALTPALARLSETLRRAVRQDFAATMRDVVARAVGQELARRRGR